MSRLTLFEDTISHLCYRYIHNELKPNHNVIIYNAVSEIVDKKEVIPFIVEIAYRIGYAHSIIEDMSEVTYKKKKKAIRDRLSNLNKYVFGELK